MTSSVAWTARVLLGGTVASALLFSGGFCLRLVDATGLADAASGAGVVVLMLTPALALVASVIELRRHQPQAAMFAVGVLGVLALAVAIALLAA